MKKYLRFVVLLYALMLAARANAVTEWTSSNCEDKGGSIVAINGKDYCKATSTMKWWTAYAWCEAMGGHMPSVLELCPNIPSITSGATCGTINSDWKVWTSTPYGSQKVYLHYRGLHLGDAANKHYSNGVYCLPGPVPSNAASSN